jgi:HTH-type transcriptional regulator, sugar sensing transcriptional regulator
VETEKHVWGSLYIKKRLSANGNVEDEADQEQDGAEAIIKYLQDFGLTRKEAKTFFALSKMGSSTATEISGATQFSRLQTYRAIKGLLDNGLVEMSLERPRRYTPLKIEQALNLLGQEAERKILELEKKTPLLLKQWLAVSDLQVDKTNYSFRIIQGAKNVAKFRIMLYESSKNDIAATMKPNDLMKLVTEGADDVFENLKYNNISIRGLSEVNKFNLDASKRFLEFSKLNHTTNSNIVPFTIIDEQEALICLSKDGKDGIPENAIWTNHPDMVRILKEIFEMLWKTSQEGNSRIREIEHKLISQTEPQKTNSRSYNLFLPESSG